MRFEDYIQPLLELKFPNYLYWQEEFLDPLIDKFDGNWRSDTHEDLGKMAMASFGIIKSLVFIQHRKDKINTSAGDYDQSFKNIYQHFTLIFDCLEAMCHKIILLRNIVRLPPVLEEYVFTREELNNDFAVWMEKKYDKIANRYVEYGIPITFPVNNKQFLKILLADQTPKSYVSFVQSVREYRNFFAHNPGVDVFRKGDILFALKKEHVKKAANWSDIRNHYANNQSLFTCPKAMIQDDLNELLLELNNIWLPIMDVTRELYKNEGLKSYFRGYKKMYQ